MRRDCVNALRVGAWEEATKLFTILGRRNRGSDAWRYQLAFYECVGCAEHAARFAVHESVIRPGGQEWEQKSEATIAYAGAGTAKPRMLLPNLFGLLKSQLESIRPKAEEPKVTRMFK